LITKRSRKLWPSLIKSCPPRQVKTALSNSKFHVRHNMLWKASKFSWDCKLRVESKLSKQKCNSPSIILKGSDHSLASKSLLKLEMQLLFSKSQLLRLKTRIVKCNSK
jgi:hypothetical protein